MKTLKSSTKKGQRFVDDYFACKVTDLSNCYNSFSTRKAAAQEYCTMLMNQEKGWGFRILSWNTFQFTCAWIVRDTDNGSYSLRIETKCNSYIVKGEDILPFTL